MKRPTWLCTWLGASFVGSRPGRHCGELTSPTSLVNSVLKYESPGGADSGALTIAGDLYRTSVPGLMCEVNDSHDVRLKVK
jgi:hypothetical protein